MFRLILVGFLGFITPCALCLLFNNAWSLFGELVFVGTFVTLELNATIFLSGADGTDGTIDPSLLTSNPPAAPQAPTQQPQPQQPQPQQPQPQQPQQVQQPAVAPAVAPAAPINQIIDPYGHGRRGFLPDGPGNAYNRNLANAIVNQIRNYGLRPAEKPSLDQYASTYFDQALHHFRPNM